MTFFIIVLMFSFLLLFISLMNLQSKLDSARISIKRFEKDQIFTATETGMYNFVGHAPVMIITPKTVGCVFYHKELDRIIDGNELELLGDL